MGNVLEGKGTGAQMNVVLVNAALGIQVMHSEKSFYDCLNEVKNAVFEGRVAENFKELVKRSKAHSHEYIR